MDDLIAAEEKLGHLLYEFQKNSDPTKITEYFTYMSALLNFVIGVERASANKKLKKEVDMNPIYADLKLLIATMKILNVPKLEFYENIIKKKDVIGGAEHPKKVILGSAEKQYKCGQRIAQYKQDLEIIGESDKRTSAELIRDLELDCPFKILHKDVEVLAFSVIDYLVYMSKNVGHSAQGSFISDNDTIKLEFNNFRQEYHINYHDIKLLIADIMAQIQELDMERFRRYVQKVKSLDKSNIKSILGNMSGTLKLTDLVSERHRAKVEIIAKIENLEEPLIDDTSIDSLENYEKTSEKYARLLNIIISDINSFLSFDRKDTCINHCYRVADIFILPALLGEAKLQDAIEKKYGAKYDLTKEDDLKDYVSAFC
jgi:hypothetical protein